MSDGWTYDPPEDETGNEVECEGCSRTIAPTEPCFSHRDHLRQWAYLCTTCVCVRLSERDAP